MKWTYKKIDIEVNESGMFCFSFDGKVYESITLQGARDKIDELTDDYYTFTKDDYKKLLKKLENRERDFVATMVEELSHHIHNAYCGLGVDIEFKVDFDKLINPF